MKRLRPMCETLAIQWRKTGPRCRQRRVLGEDHPATRRSARNLAGLLQTLEEHGP